MALFESYERRIDKINEVLAGYGISSIEEAQQITKDAGLDVYNQIKGIQPICFENAKWAYTVGCAIALKKGVKSAATMLTQHLRRLRVSTAELMTQLKSSTQEKNKEEKDNGFI